VHWIRHVAGRRIGIDGIVKPDLIEHDDAVHVCSVCVHEPAYQEPDQKDLLTI
jgi:hypothetical protein